MSSDMIWMNMLICISMTMAALVCGVKGESSSVRPGEAAYYLDVDANVPSVGADDELKRAQRSFWTDLFRGNAFDDLFQDDRRDRCCNGNCEIGNGDTYNQPQTYSSAPVADSNYNPYYPPLPPPLALRPLPPLPPLRPLRPWRPWRPFRPFYMNNYGPVNYRNGYDNGNNYQYNNKGGYDNNSKGYSNKAVNAYEGNGYNENNGNLNKVNYDNKDGSDNYNNQAPPENEVYNNKPEVNYEKPESGNNYTEDYKPQSKTDYNKSDDYNTNQEAAPNCSQDSVPHIGGGETNSVPSNYGANSPQIVYQPIIYISPQSQSSPKQVQSYDIEPTEDKTPRNDYSADTYTEGYVQTTTETPIEPVEYETPVEQTKPEELTTNKPYQPLVAPINSLPMAIPVSFCPTYNVNPCPAISPYCGYGHQIPCHSNSYNLHQNHYSNHIPMETPAIYNPTRPSAMPASNYNQKESELYNDPSTMNTAYDRPTPTTYSESNSYSMTAQTENKTEYKSSLPTPKPYEPLNSSYAKLENQQQTDKIPYAEYKPSCQKIDDESSNYRKAPSSACKTCPGQGNSGITVFHTVMPVIANPNGLYNMVPASSSMPNSQFGSTVTNQQAYDKYARSVKMTLADQPYRTCPELFDEYHTQLAYAKPSVLL